MLRVSSRPVRRCHRTVFFFFFQAEDGIRDLVRSRGLGDVYKRQAAARPAPSEPEVGRAADHRPGRPRTGRSAHRAGPVSYTHLTLPTSDLV